MKVNSPKDAEVIVQKASCDMGIHRNPRKGTLNAPDVILDDFEFSHPVMVDEVFPDEFDLEETQERIEQNTQELAGYGKPLLSIGGDHSISYPVLKALKARYPDLGLAWLDSHLDLKEKVDGHVSHDVVIRELLEKGIFEEDEVWLVGITRRDKDERNFLEEHEVRVFGADELQDFSREFDSGEHPVYLSVDIDVLKENEAPGTGYPDGELALEQVKEVIAVVEPDFADIVEVAPPLDSGGKTLENSREILSELGKVLKFQELS